jgi:hypothetical protein
MSCSSQAIRDRCELLRSLAATVSRSATDPDSTKLNIRVSFEEERERIAVFLGVPMKIINTTPGFAAQRNPANRAAG